MDLREKIAEAIEKHEASPTKAYLILDAVMGVVEEDAEKRRAYTERRVGLARKAEAAIWERRIREQKEEGDAIIAEEQARVRALEDENQRMRENVRLKNRAAYLSAINACMARLQGQTDITAVFPALHEMRDRAVELHNAALSRAREIAEEEA